MARLEDILVNAIVGAQQQANRNALNLGALGQIGGFEAPERAANVPIDPQTFIQGLSEAARTGTTLATRPGDVAGGLAQAQSAQALAGQREASAERTEALTPFEVQTEQARGESFRQLAEQRAAGAAGERQDIFQNAQLFQTQLDQENQRLVNLREQAETEEAQQGFIHARTRTQILESEAEVERLQAVVDATNALASFRRAETQTEEELRPGRVALGEEEVATQQAETATEQAQAQVETEQAAAIRRESLQTVQSAQIDDAMKVRIADATVDKFEEQTRKYGLEADRIEMITPILAQFESAKLLQELAQAREAQATADIEEARVSFESEMNDLALETERKVQEQYDARIAEIRARADLTQAQEFELIAQLEIDLEKAKAWIATETNKAGVQAALVEYHEARTGEVEANADLIRQSIPLELQVLQNEADWRAQRVALIDQQIETEAVETDQARQQLAQEREEHEARIRDIEADIRSQAAAARVSEAEAREAEAQAEIAESGARVAEATEEATIQQTIADAREAVTDYEFKRRTLESRVQEQNLAPTIDSINALLDANELQNIDPIDLILLDSLSERGLVPESLADQLTQSPIDRLPALRPLVNSVKNQLDLADIVGEEGADQETTGGQTTSLAWPESVSINLRRNGQPITPEQNEAIKQMLLREIERVGSASALSRLILTDQATRDRIASSGIPVEAFTAILGSLSEAGL